ncbi:hypothetical protein BaRGS_00030847 [Batillaria attramentaria]|uniref:Uncharacterized protein n=1 Tax=Batillaria attramentaria TaxID=370345 RepID=A0ABD0JS66_9CAEN
MTLNWTKYMDEFQMRSTNTPRGYLPPQGIKFPAVDKTDIRRTDSESKWQSPFPLSAKSKRTSQNMDLFLSQAIEPSRYTNHAEENDLKAKQESSVVNFLLSLVDTMAVVNNINTPYRRLSYALFNFLRKDVEAGIFTMSRKVTQIAHSQIIV